MTDKEKNKKVVFIKPETTWFDEKEYLIKHGANSIATWSDDWLMDCPEDLTFSRSIGSIADRCLNYGIQLERERAKGLVEFVVSGVGCDNYQEGGEYIIHSSSCRKCEALEKYRG